MNNRGTVMLALCLATCISACGTPERQGTVKTDTNVPVSRTGHLQEQIAQAKADDFGEFIVEVHKAGSNLIQAEQEQANGNIGQGEQAVERALTHRIKAEDAFLRLVSVLEDTSTMQDLSDRLTYLEAIHVTEGEEIPALNVYFSFSGSQLNRAEEDKISKLVESMQVYPIFALKLVGYADTVGSKERNLRLAEARNYAVLRTLHREGMPINTLVSIAVGEAEGPDEVRNPENRRVEIIPYVHGRDPRVAEAIAEKEDKLWEQEVAKLNLDAEDEDMPADDTDNTDDDDMPIDDASDEDMQEEELLEDDSQALEDEAASK